LNADPPPFLQPGIQNGGLKLREIFFSAKNWQVFFLKRRGGVFLFNQTMEEVVFSFVLPLTNYNKALYNIGVRR